MTDPTRDDTVRAASEADMTWSTPDPAVPAEQLTDRELIARAEHCDEIAHAGDSANQAAALRELDAAWEEAERRATDQAPASVPAQVAGYIGLVREDYDRALSAEAATWRDQLHTALPGAGTARAGQPALRTADQHGAYHDGRPAVGAHDDQPYNPAAEYGDVDWREPSSDGEAAARTGYIRDHFPVAPGWAPLPLTEVEDAMEDAAERAVLSDRAHDHDPYAWAEYERLRALDSLVPLPARQDALDDLRDEEANGDLHDEVVAPTTVASGELEVVRCGPFGRGTRDLPAGSAVDVDEEQRREQLNRWHDDDRNLFEVAENDRGDTDNGADGTAGVSSQGWSR